MKNVSTPHLSNKTNCLCYQCLLDKYQENKETKENKETNNLIHINKRDCLCYQCLLDKYQESLENDKLENLREEISK
jgi:hypothetical protein